MRNFSGNVRKATFGKQYRKSFKKDTGAEAAPTADHESIHLPTLNASPNAGVGAVSRQNSRVCATSYFGNAQRDIGGRPFLCQIKKGVWCPFCVGRHKTIVDMQNLAKKRGGRCLSRSYSGKEKKLLWECSLGHRWKAVPGSIIMGTWCHAEAKPDPLRGFARLELALRLRTDLSGESSTPSLMFCEVRHSCCRVAKRRKNPVSNFATAVRTLCSFSSSVRNSFSTAVCN